MSLSRTVSKISSLISENLKRSRDLNTSFQGIIYHACTSTLVYQSAHAIWNAKLHRFQRYNWGPKFIKMGHVTLTTPIREYVVIQRISLDIYYLHTKFGDSCCSCSGNMIASIESENGSRSNNLLDPIWVQSYAAVTSRLYESWEHY